MSMNTIPVQTEPSATARALAELALSLRLSDVPAEVLAHSKLIVRDTIAVILAGSRLPRNQQFRQVGAGARRRLLDAVWR
jgi:hypothetical protein